MPQIISSKPAKMREQEDTDRQMENGGITRQVFYSSKEQKTQHHWIAKKESTPSTMQEDDRT